MEEGWTIISLNEGFIDNYLNYNKAENELKRQYMEGIKHIRYRRTSAKSINGYFERRKYEYIYNILTSASPDYREYTKAFKILCDDLRIPLDCEMRELKMDDNMITATWSAGRYPIIIPEGFVLIHKSSVLNLHYLEPSFKSLRFGMYMRPEKRIYFTIEKSMTHKFTSSSEATKVYSYTPTQNIRIAYIDMSIPFDKYYAVYIPTNDPIEVVEYHRSIFRKFMYNGDNNVSESMFSLPSITNYNRWRINTNENIKTDKYINMSLSDREYSELKSLIDIMNNVRDYSTYKIYFNKFCYMCNINPNGVVLYNIHLSNKEENRTNTNYIKVIYKSNTKKIVIPDHSILYHFSNIPNLKELYPSFRSKIFNKYNHDQRYFYSTPRVYFSLNDHISNWFIDYKYGTKLYKYICTEPIIYAYIDPLITDYINKSIYVETNTPIKVISEEDYIKLNNSTI